MTVQYFMGQCISGVSGAGNIQLWNPWGSGKILRVSRVLVAGALFSGSDPLGADIRRTREPFSTVFADHATNKVFGGPSPSAEIRTYDGTAPSNYPLNRPIQEIWLANSWKDTAYQFEPNIEVPQGWGVAVSMTGGARGIVSWQWAECVDPQGPITADPWTPVEAVVSSLNNGTNAFDASDTTYADDTPSGTSSFYIGKTWAEEKTITCISIKSPVGRSFAGAAPPRVFSYAVETFNGSTWYTATSGSFTDLAYNSQSVLTISGSWTGYGHRVRMTDSAVASHRVATMTFT